MQISCKLQIDDIVKREEWKAAPYKRIDKKINDSLIYVLILHTADPGACWDTEDCKDVMYQMQKIDQEVRKWNDIHMK